MVAPTTRLMVVGHPKVHTAWFVARLSFSATITAIEIKLHCLSLYAITHMGSLLS